MAENQRCAAERIIEDLESTGWKVQNSGISYINGKLGTNLLRDGEVMTVLQDFCPDEEFLEQEWGAEASDDDLF